MIRAFVSVVVRSLVELALVLVVIGALLLALAGIMGQRIVTTNPNLVERAAERIGGVLASLTRGVQAARTGGDDDELGVDPNDFEYDDEEDEIGRRLRRGPFEHDDWSGLVV